MTPNCLPFDEKVDLLAKTLRSFAGALGVECVVSMVAVGDRWAMVNIADDESEWPERADALTLLVKKMMENDFHALRSILEGAGYVVHGPGGEMN